MSDLKRYSTRDYPPYAHIPGKTPHPKKDGGYWQGLSDPDSYELTEENWQSHQDYRYAVDLFNAEFYWEAHVWWEAIWKSMPKGDGRDFIQGLIKLAASALKYQMNENDIALGHALRAKELMSNSYTSGESYIFGVSRIWWNNIDKSTSWKMELSDE